MPTHHLDTVRAYWDASARRDYETAGRYVAPTYVWIDHMNRVVARTPDELMTAAAEDTMWSDRTFEITNTLETVDGALIVQATVSGVLSGKFHAVVANGQRTSSESCTIFRFDADGRITLEEHYGDALTIIEQLTSSAYE